MVVECNGTGNRLHGCEMGQMRLDKFVARQDKLDRICKQTRVRED